MKSNSNDKSQKINFLIHFFLKKKFIRYLLSGALVLVFNMMSVWFFLEFLEWNADTFERNFSHFLGMELSVLLGFCFHNFWTWKSKERHIFRKLFEFHLITGFTIIIRQIIFYYMDASGFDWYVSTLLPILLAVVINFLGYDRIVFQKLQKKEQI